MIAVCLGFFSPCDYELPKQHLARTLQWLAGEGVLTAICQVVRPGQEPQPVPAGMRSAVYESSDTLFFKECLWNKATALVPEADRFLFLDTDLRFSREDVIEATAALLDQVDVCQPFDTAAWHDQNGVVFQAKRSAAYAIAKGREPMGRLFHPGFAWGMTRRAFDLLGGFYDRHPIGGGDIAFTYSLDARWAACELRKRLPHDAHFWVSPSFEAYRAAATATRLRVGFLPYTECYHSWHGEIVNRQYTSRGVYMPLEHGEEYPLTRRPDGLLAWRSAEDSERVRAYFTGRREDG
jgi:hypothetical protein